MIVLLNRFRNFIKSRTVAIVMVAALLAPSISFAQGSAQNQATEDEPAVQSGAADAGPWSNSAGATVGTRDNSSTAPATDPRLGPGGGTLGRPAGPTPDATGGPGGNPDVPFDTSMNLMFLAAGIVFAYVVYRRKLKVKPVAAESK